MLLVLLGHLRLQFLSGYVGNACVRVYLGRSVSQCEAYKVSSEFLHVQ